MPPARSFICDCPVLPQPRLIHDIVRVREVATGQANAWEDGVLQVGPLPACDLLDEPLIVSAVVDVIPPHGRDIPCDTIMDIMPLAAKREGGLGAGVSRVAQGVTLVLTGRDEAGEQIGEFGHSAGILSQRMSGDAAGTPDPDDWIVRVAVTLRAGVAREREGPLAAHRLADRVLDGLRGAILQAPDHAVVEQRTYEGEQAGALRVVLVKEVMGQGAMHDNLLLPRQPGGVAGGRSIIDLGNLPFLLRPNELRDGALHSLCCVGPSTKETTLHYFRDPLVRALADDPQVDLAGVIVFGSPATERDKRFVAERVGAAVHATGADGAILATEGFGNNHVDFALALKEIAAYGMPCVGVTWAARQGRLVAGNEYLVALVEVNRSPSGRESQIVAENTARPQDARRAVALLKSLITGIDILPAPPEWDPSVVAENDRLVEEEAAFAGGIPSATAGLRSEVPVPRMQPGQLARLASPLAQARVALVTASGAYQLGQEPFDLAGDHSHRLIPANSPADHVVFASGGYDHTDVNRDPNAMLPLKPLQELVAAGHVGSTTDAHIGFQGGGGDLDLVREKLGPAVLSRLREMHADAVLFTAG